MDFKDRMEELDFMNDKKVMLRAVYEDQDGAEGREMTAGLIKTDEEVRRMREIERNRFKKKAVVQDVIEIVDDD